MNFMRKTMLFGIATLAMGLGVSAASARTIVVGSCTSGGLHFSTIQAAVSAAFAKDKITICPGTYKEQVVLTRDLTLTNVAGMASPVIAAPDTGIVANATSPTTNEPIAAQIAAVGTPAAPLAKVTIQNLVVDGANNQINGCSPDLVGILFQNANGLISSNTVQNHRLSDPLLGCQVGLGIFVQNTAPTPTGLVTITKNSVVNFQKNGITADESGTSFKIVNNTVTGLGPTPAIAQNGIQVAYGSTGSIASNTVSALIYTGPTYASTGILGYASGGMTIKSNKIASSQYGISVDSDPTYGNADGNTIVSNTIQNTQTYDGIDVCSNNNSVTKNTVNSSQEAGIHLDGLCTGTDGATGLNNLVSGNKINGACAGILSGPAQGANNIGTNKILNASYTVLYGSDVCTAPTLARQSSAKASLAPSRLETKPARP